MKKRIGAFVVATVMTASLAALPANAMSYTVEGAKERNFGPITSVEFEIPAAGQRNSLTCAESTEAIMSLSVPAV